MKTTAYIGGTFDLLHYGHLWLFKQAHQNYDRVVVSVNNDAFVERFKRKPILSLQERMETVASCKWVDHVIENFGDEDSRPAMLSVNTTHFVHGSDWTGASLHKQLGVTQDWLDEHKIEIVYFPLYGKISTSEILRRAAAR